MDATKRQKKIPFLYVPMPQAIWDKNIDLTLADFRLLGYIIRHQLAWGNKDVRLSDEELMNGRKRKGGERFDAGCGITGVNNIRRARQKLQDLGWIKVEADLSDAARPKRYYSVIFGQNTKVSDSETHKSATDRQVPESDTQQSETDTKVSVSDTRTYSSSFWETRVGVHGGGISSSSGPASGADASTTAAVLPHTLDLQDRPDAVVIACSLPAPTVPNGTHGAGNGTTDGSLVAIATDPIGQPAPRVALATDPTDTLAHVIHRAYLKAANARKLRPYTNKGKPSPDDLLIIEGWLLSAGGDSNEVLAKIDTVLGKILDPQDRAAASPGGLAKPVGDLLRPAVPPAPQGDNGGKLSENPAAVVAMFRAMALEAFPSAKIKADPSKEAIRVREEIYTTLRNDRRLSDQAIRQWAGWYLKAYLRYEGEWAINGGGLCVSSWAATWRASKTRGGYSYICVTPDEAQQQEKATAKQA